MIVHLSSLRDSVYRNEIVSLLTLCDDDFVPSLSSSRTLHPSASTEEKLHHYLQQKDPFHHYLLAFHPHKPKIIGMLNFVVTNTHIEVDTICVHPDFRNQQIGYSFYAFLMGKICPLFQLKQIEVVCSIYATAHLHLLKKLHFQQNEHVPTHSVRFSKKNRF